MQQVSGMSDDAREAAILGQLLQGNIPAFLRHLSPVVLSEHLANGRLVKAIVCVSPDYLAIGTDRDFMLVPMRLRTALTVAMNFGFTLPTRKLVDAIYRQAPVHLQPQPLAARRHHAHHRLLLAPQRTGAGAAAGFVGAAGQSDSW